MGEQKLGVQMLHRHIFIFSARYHLFLRAFSLPLAWKHGPDKDQMVFVISRMDYWVVSHLKLNVYRACKFWLVYKLAVHFLESSSLCSNLSQEQCCFSAPSAASFPGEQKVQAFATWDTPFWSRNYLSPGQHSFQGPRWGVRGPWHWGPAT